MKRKPANPDSPKSRAIVLLDHGILVLCLFVIALRATFVESVQPGSISTNISDTLHSLSVSFVLIFAFVLWFLLNLCGKKFSYRPTAMEAGLCLLILAAVVSGLAAPDKRQAINHITIFLAPILMALLLVQLLDSPSKVTIVLAVIAALGVVSTGEAIEQRLISNQVTIEQYEQDPNSFLRQLSIEPDSLRIFLFEHRLYSRGVRGFFTTRNSLGSFLLMAFFAAVALLIDKLNSRKAESLRLRYLLACGAAAAFLLLGLALTRSKGGIIGLVFAALLLAAYLRLGPWLKAHRRIILIASLLLVIGGVCAVASYGLKHDRLPGGTSMLVRWQYWRAAGAMYADHPLTGVGPGHFSDFYTRYKPAAAIESVADPHNFPLSILTQYGPLGLVALLAMVCLPLWRVTGSAPPQSPAVSPAVRRAPLRTLALTCSLLVSVALLVVRPIISPSTQADTLLAIIYVIVRLYVAPVALFFIGFLLLTAPLRKIPAGGRPQPRESVVVPALFCAVLGVGLHNLIDFAIFEPGVWTTFWAMMACIIAADAQRKPRRMFTAGPAPLVTTLAMLAVMAAFLASIILALVPVTSSTTKTQLARQAVSAGRFEYAHRLLEKAAEDDKLSPAAFGMNARLYLSRFESAVTPDRELLISARESLLASIRRSNADFKDFERLTEVCTLLADTTAGPQKADWLNKAYEAGRSTIKRYPACARIRVDLGKIAERMGKSEQALAQYRKALEIEDDYRRQFRIMYPERKQIVSRLGDYKYRFTEDRIAHLTSLLAHPRP